MLTDDTFKQHQIRSDSILIVNEHQPAKIYLIYDNKIMLINNLDTIDQLTTEDLYSRTNSHFNINSGYYETEIYIDGKFWNNFCVNVIIFKIEKLF